MNRTALIGLIAAAALAGCGPKPAETNTAAAETAPAPKGADMSKMGMAAETKLAKGMGTVTAIDPAAGTITLAHGPIPEAGWPAMTMAFKASPAVIGQVKTGDKVDFDLKLEDGAGQVTAVTKAP